MQQIHFLVQGSAQDPYAVTFTLDGGALRAFCSCQAGINGMACKHRMAILSGITESIVSSNLGDADTVKSWLTGTPLESAIARADQLELEFAALSARFPPPKKT